MSQRSKNECMKLTGISSILHFLVDGLCICCLSLTTENCTHIVAAYLTYNVLAFLTQPFTGWWVDRMRQKHWMLLSSALLLTVAVMTAAGVTSLDSSNATESLLFVMATFLGLGNSFFHVWGGKQTAVCMKNDIRALGVFVSTGAFGLAIGALFASWLLLYIFLLSICGLVMVVLLQSPKEAYTQPDDHHAVLSIQAVIWGIIALIMLIVAARSFTGEAFTTGITKMPALIMLLGATSMLGKMAGGWLVKGLGMWKAVALMVVGAVLCFLGKDVHVAIMLTGLFLVNCTMPVTLYWANVMLKGKEGLAFGLLAAALIPGYLLALS